MLKTIFTLFIVSFLLSSCATTLDKVYPTLNDGKYDSEFPYKSSSSELDEIRGSVQRVNTTAFYKIYHVKPDNDVTYEMLNEGILNTKTQMDYGNNSLSGTAFTIYAQNGAIALVTCAHILSYPDTIIVHRALQDGTPTPYIETISIKEKEYIYVAGFPEGSEVDVLAQDDQNDIALIGRKYSPDTGFHTPVFPYPAGDAKELEWGTFVYLFGYPINYQMVTKAIVSSPNRDSEGSFLVDAVVNPGFSGGLVLAIRDGVPHFELVGMVQWVPEEEETFLAPQKLSGGKTYNTLLPYKGDVFPAIHKSIKYGITKVIPIESIRAFLQKNRVMLKSMGYEIYLKSVEK